MNTEPDQATDARDTTDQPTSDVASPAGDAPLEATAEPSMAATGQRKPVGTGRIKIGSQRPATVSSPARPRASAAIEPPSAPTDATGTEAAADRLIAPIEEKPAPPTERQQQRTADRRSAPSTAPQTSQEPAGVADESPPARPSFPPPRLDRMTPDLEAEFEAAVGDESIEQLMAGGDAITSREQLDPDSRHQARVVAMRREDVFVDLGGRDQGVVPLKQFAESPQIGQQVEVIVQGFEAAEGLYTLALPGAAVDVGDWSQLSEGITVEARVTGHNKGGLECEVGSVRAFIPLSQIDLYRVTDVEPLVGEKFACIVTEANPERRNLVLSRRAVLEREQEAARERLLAELAPGQIREGVVRNVRDFGAFIDLGGVDGLLHVSQMSWNRIEHPSELLQPGQSIKVKVLKIDHDSQKISLGLKDLLQNPWHNVDTRYPVGTTHEGKVTRLADFGAFVELEAGLEGLVHVSELSHHRVARVRDAVEVGQQVTVQVVSFDRNKHRIGLSIKAVMPDPATEAAQAATDDSEPAEPRQRKYAGPLKGGVDRPSGGEQFGLKW